MGLDQYLSKRIYIDAEYKHNNVNGTIEIRKGKDQKLVKVNMSKVSYIEESAMYWRKCNQVHKWFVDNVQNGEDDCGNYDVSTEQLQELVNLCKEAIANKDRAEELLPTTQGFFFGGTDYDEWYWQDLQETVDKLQPLIDESKEDYDVSF